MLKKDELMPVFGIAVMVTALFVILKKYGEQAQASYNLEIAENE